METLEQIKMLVETLSLDATKFYNGTRARKSAQEIKALMQTLRTEILNYSKEEK